MGLIRAAIGGLNSTLKDGYLDYIMCDELSQFELIKVGRRGSDKNSSNKGNTNVITDGSTIAIGSGQCALMISDGKVIDFCAEPGTFTWDTGAAPSMMHSGFEGLKGMMSTVKDRFKHGGYTGMNQYVYYINTVNIGGNKVGKGDIPFRDVEFNLTAKLKCFGTYEYKIVNPIKFFETHVGFGGVGEDGVFFRDEIDDRLRPAVLQALEPAFAMLSLKKISVELIGLSTKELSKALSDELSDEWREKRGIDISDMKVSITVDEKSMERIAKFQDTRVMTNTEMARGRMTEATANAMEFAGQNEGGAMMGFMGMNMAQTMGSSAISATANANQNINRSSERKTEIEKSPMINQNDMWVCTSCKQDNTGKFCSNCGEKQPIKQTSNNWHCKNCNIDVTGNFCSECGQKKPKVLDSYCESCGFESNSPFKFCPECGSENIE